jgi:methylated-DNA-protein-cysteine methyltransferase related protein
MTMKLMKTFSDRVIEIALSIPKGRVTTYGRISRAAGGGAMSSQSITGILGKAYKEEGLDIPFHRIVYADGSIWVNQTHYKKRMKLYKEEKIEIDKNNKIKNFKDIVLELR